MFPSKTHKIVIIDVVSYGVQPPAPDIKGAQHIKVSNMSGLGKALKTLNDGDILVWHGHSNKIQYAMGSGITS